MKNVFLIPKYAMVIKGHWKKGDNYGDVWCKIIEINMETKHMSLRHPEYGEFAWVSIKECKFK